MSQIKKNFLQRSYSYLGHNSLLKNSNFDLSHSCSDLTNFDALDLVWVKRTGYPWYPALILDSEKLADELNKINLKVKRMPSRSFLGKKKTDDQLVFIFGRKNCWHWIGNEDGLRKFGVDDIDLVTFNKNPKLKQALDEAQETFLSIRSRKNSKV